MLHAAVESAFLWQSDRATTRQLSMPSDPLDSDELARGEATDPRLDHPWAVWATFRGMKTWLFRQETPPTLRHPRFAVRLLRMMTLMGAIAAVSVTASVAGMGFEMAMDAAGANWPFKGLGLMLLPGVWFGLFVLVPLSRWQGRNWWLTVPAAAISTGIYWCAVLAFLQFMPIMSSGPDKSWPLAGLAAGTVGGLGLAVWMNPPWSRRAALVIVASTIAGIIGGSSFAFLFHHEPRAGWLPEPVARLLAMFAMFGPFQCGVAMALGWRLVESDSLHTGD